MDQTIYFKSLATLTLLLVATAGFTQETIDFASTLPPGEQLAPVADEEPEEAVDDAAPEPAEDPELTDIEMLQAQFERYKQLMQDGVHDEADSVAKRVGTAAPMGLGPPTPGQSGS